MNLKPHKLSGFTLVELLICVAIIGILASIAYPRYTSFLAHTHRVKAQQNLLILAKNMEHYRLENKNYLGAEISMISTNKIDQDTHYHYQITKLADNSYLLSAIPAEQQAAHDQSCGTLSINQLGTVGTNHPDNTNECWGI